MNEFNNGLRPHYDKDFDEAIAMSEQGAALDTKHVLALGRYTQQGNLHFALVKEQEVLINHR